MLHYSLSAGSVTTNRVETDGDVSRIFLCDPRGAETAVCLVDTDMLPVLLRRRWCLRGRPIPYVVGHMSRREARESGRPRSMIYMHRAVMEAPAGVEVDHINGDKLDNRRSNLRLVTRAQNAQNMRRRPMSIRGVYFDKRSAPRGWFTQIRVGGVSEWRGFFDTAEEAAVVAKELRAKLMPFCNENRA